MFLTSPANLHTYFYPISLLMVLLGNVSFPHEAIRGLDFFSAQVDAFPNITSGRRPRVIWRNASTSAEKKPNPRIASWGKGIL